MLDYQARNYLFVAKKREETGVTIGQDTIYM